MFTAVVAMIAGILPVLTVVARALGRTPTAALKDGFGGSSSAMRQRGGSLVIVVEVALAMTLAVAGVLLLKSFARLTAVAPGFDAAQVLSFKVFLGPPRYRSVASEKQYVREALGRLATLPGVEDAATVTQLPLGDPASGQPFEIDGRVPPVGERPMIAYRAVSADYFNALRIPFVRGRRFSDDDRQDSTPVVVINDAAAKRFFPGGDPIGQRIHWVSGIAAFDATRLTIVGVVADVKSSGLDKPEAPAIYAPYTQRVFPWLRWNSFVVRTHGDPATYERTIREEMTKVDPLQPIYQIVPLDAVVAQSVAARRFHTSLLDLFAALALVLCSVGVYGTINYWVAERARELGVRMALGATRRRIRSMVVGRAGALTAIGIALGVMLSIATTRALSTMLYGVQPFDIGTMAIASAIVLTTGAAAAYIPARRASSVDPLSVIRGD
jgi:putative ABC transport system permease protein